MSNFLMFAMVTAIFVHTFINFLGGVWTALVAKVKGTPVGGFFSSAEAFFGNLFGSVIAFFKKL